VCSIAGWYCWGKSRPTPNALKGMLIAGRSRGTDAAGVCWQAPNGKIMLSKERGDAKDFIGMISDEAWAEIASSPTGLLHNRAKTKGTEYKPENNHPVSAFGWVVVHNGTLTNDDDVFEYHKEVRPADVDTVAINMLLSTQKDYYDSFRELTVLSGGCTAAMWKLDEPDKLGIIRLGPNELFLWEADGVIYWSSAPLASQALPYKSMGCLAFQNTALMPEDRLLVLDRVGGKARTFAMTRNPFLPPRKAKVYTFPPTADLPAGTLNETAGTPAAPVPVPPVPSGKTANKQESLHYRWEGSGKVNDIIKPPPMFDNVTPVWSNLMEVMARVRNSAAAYENMLTAYGTWHFTAHDYTPTNGGTSRVVERRFTGAKRQKPFLGEILGEMYPKLPALDSAFDLKLPLEVFILVVKMPETGVSFQYPGFMCPVCGITMLASEWHMTGMKCKFCNIKHYLPGPKKDPA